MPKDITSKHCPKIERGETLYLSENLAPSEARNRTTGSDIGKAPRCNHCAIVPCQEFMLANSNLIFFSHTLYLLFTLRPERKGARGSGEDVKVLRQRDVIPGDPLHKPLAQQAGQGVLDSPVHGCRGGGHPPLLHHHEVFPGP